MKMKSSKIQRNIFYSLFNSETSTYKDIENEINKAIHLLNQSLDNIVDTTNSEKYNNYILSNEQLTVAKLILTKLPSSNDNSENFFLYYKILTNSIIRICGTNEDYLTQSEVIFYRLFLEIFRLQLVLMIDENSDIRINQLPVIKLNRDKLKDLNVFIG